MKFCPECGSNVEGMKFCGECGYSILNETVISEVQNSLTEQQTEIQNPVQKAAPVKSVINPDYEEILWEGKQSVLFGLNEKMRYKATDNIELKMKEDIYQITPYIVRIIHDSTMKKTEDVINFEDIKDVKVKQGLKDKMQGLGDLIIFLNNGSETVMKGIKNPEEPKQIIMSKALEYQRNRTVLHRKDI